MICTLPAAPEAASISLMAPGDRDLEVENGDETSPAEMTGHDLPAIRHIGGATRRTTLDLSGRAFLNATNGPIAATMTKKLPFSNK